MSAARSAESGDRETARHLRRSIAAAGIATTAISRHRNAKQLLAKSAHHPPKMNVIKHSLHCLHPLHCLVPRRSSDKEAENSVRHESLAGNEPCPAEHSPHGLDGDRFEDVTVAGGSNHDSPGKGQTGVSGGGSGS